MSNISLPAINNENGLKSYLEEISKFPYLTEEEEYQLAKKWAESGDIDAAHRLVTSHLRLVAKIAMGYRGYGLPMLEVISEGNIGLMQAIKKFDPEKGFRLSTYSMWWIKASIQEYVLKSWSLVKIGTTAAQKKLFFNLKRIKKNLQKVTNSQLSDEEVKKIATQLDVTEQEVITMDSRTSLPDLSLNSYVNNDDESTTEMIEMLTDSEEDFDVDIAEKQDSIRKKKLFALAMKELNDREKYILTERKLRDVPATLDDISKLYNISRERVRQIENRAIEKLQYFVQSNA